jgi:tetratricopeptide (TPR) repeat protein
MTQARRRIVFCTVVLFLIAAGAILQANAEGDRATDSGPATAASPDLQQQKSEEAVFQSLSCAVSLVGFQLALAEKSCSTAIELLPDDPVGYKYCGLTYLLQHRFERAEMDFRDAVRLDPKDPENQAGYAQSLSGQGRFGEAIPRFGIALAMAPRDVRILSARCWARAGEGKDLPGALRDCDLALKLVPHHSVAFDSRALVQLRAGRYREAVSDYSSSLKWQPNRATALFGRGVAEIRLNRTAAARKDLFLARQSDPEIDDVYIMVGVLETGCRGGQGACSLPKKLRAAPRTASEYLSVSLHGPSGHVPR